MSKKNNKKFVPFAHDNLELKNQFIEWARILKANTEQPEAQLASVIIYTNFVEYLAEHILKTLKHIMYQATYNYFAAIIFVNSSSGSDPKFMWEKLKELDKYEFPDKQDILNLFRQIIEKRNNLFHNLAKTDENELVNFGQDLASIQELSETLFAKINTVYTGLQKILYGVESEAEKKTEDKETQNGTT